MHRLLICHHATLGLPPPIPVQSEVIMKLDFQQVARVQLIVVCVPGIARDAQAEKAKKIAAAAAPKRESPGCRSRATTAKEGEDGPPIRPSRPSQEL